MKAQTVENPHAWVWTYGKKCDFKAFKYTQ